MPRYKEDAQPFNYEGRWHLRRRVPKVFATVEKRRIVMVSTGIPVVNDPKGIAAKQIVRRLDESLFELWRSRAAGVPDSKVTYEAAVRVTRELGVPLVPHSELMASLRGVVGRLEIIESRQAVDRQTKTDAFALLGAVEKPAIRLSQLVEIYKELNPAEMAQRSLSQRHRWTVTRDTAVATFKKVLGEDRLIRSLTYDDVMKVNAHLQALIAEDEIVHDTANKCISRVAALFRNINKVKRLNLEDCFAGTRISGGETQQRVAFAISHVQENILAPGMFEDLNEEARDIIYMVAETGLRPSEAIYLQPKRIRLDEKIPFVEIRADGRKLKTRWSKRDVPLVGVALEVMQRNKTGFTHYRKKGASSLEALVSKALRARKLILEDGQCFYSLRHTYEMRLQGVRAPEKVITYMMGHKWHREPYGFVPLEEKVHWAKEIMFRSPFQS